MGKILKPLPVKLTVGLISREPSLFEDVRRILKAKFGPIDLESPSFAFDQTTYYEEEMGQDLIRIFFSFSRLFDAPQLTDIKIATNKIEHKFCHKKNRRINIDPGYISLSKFVLATTKSFVHRLYTGKGIFQEITLYYRGKSFEPGPWTYPDYRKNTHIAFFNTVRSKYYEQLEKSYGNTQLYRCI